MEILYTMEELKRYSIISSSLEGNRTISEAAKDLHLSTRQTKRLRKAVLMYGADGVRHGNKGKRSSRRISDELSDRIVELKKSEKYINTNFSHFQDLLKERENIVISYTPLRNILTKAGITSKRNHRSKKTHRMRARRECFGELIQADATPYDWFDTGKLVSLHGFIDDATGIPVGLYFCEHECLFGYLEVTRQMLTKYGIPAELYPDKHSVFFPTAKQNENLTIEEQLGGKTSAKTQFGAIMEELGVDMYAAPTPQAKGRIERAWNTLQDRLHEEMKMDGIKTIEKANAYLSKFLKRYIKRFGKTPTSEENKFCPVPDYLDLDILLTMRFSRVLDGAGCFTIKNKKFQVLDNKILPKAKITIYMSEKIGVLVLYNNKRYKAICVDDLPSRYTAINFDKFCKKHTEETKKFVVMMMRYDAKANEPLLTSS